MREYRLFETICQSKDENYYDAVNLYKKMYHTIMEMRCFLTTKVRKNLLFVFVILLAFKCSNSQKNNLIIPLTKLTKTDSILRGDTLFLSKDGFTSKENKFILHRVEYFLVKGDATNREVAVNNFVEMNPPTKLKKYDSYEMVFIKESPEINENKIPTSAEDLETVGFAVHKDFIYLYSWQNGVFKGQLKFENGRVVEGKKGGP